MAHATRNHLGAALRPTLSLLCDWVLHFVEGLSVLLGLKATGVPCFPNQLCLGEKEMLKNLEQQHSQTNKTER